MSVPAEMKVPKDGMEKWFLRKSFEDMGLLPKEVLWRIKMVCQTGVLVNQSLGIVLFKIM